MRSNILGRTLDLGFLSPEERDMPEARADRIAGEILSREALGRGLSLSEWVGLIKKAYGEDRTIYLSDLKGAEASYKLLNPVLPGVAKGLSSGFSSGLSSVNGDDLEVTEDILNLALQGASRLKGRENLFWDRIYYSIRDEYPIEDYEAAVSVVFQILNKNRRLRSSKVEYCGVLSPIKDMEDMPHDKAVGFLARHVIDFWYKGVPKRKLPKLTDIEWLSSDLYNASRIFKIPLTFLSSVSHQSFEMNGFSPSVLDIYGGSLHILSHVKRISQAWAPDSPYLCDLDDLAQSLGLPMKTPLDLKRKREALLLSVANAEARGGLF
jgi:hypothetical protein